MAAYLEAVAAGERAVRRQQHPPARELTERQAPVAKVAVVAVVVEPLLV